MTARNHHYLSQCYLKGFTKGGSKKSKLTVIDFKEKKFFSTIPRNVGGIRDFNRIEVEGVDPNIIEKSYAEFEGKVAVALKNVQESLNLSGDDKDYIFNLIALLSVRSPEQRENFRQFQAQIAERIMDLTLATKERWESQIGKAGANGFCTQDNVTYEEAKDFHESKKYRIEVARERHIQLETEVYKSILPCLYGRNWLLIYSDDQECPLITTDNPVNLCWKEPRKIPPVYQNSPGFGLKNTQVYFPLSRSVALLGEFEGKRGILHADKRLVAALNSKMILFAYKQLYSPKLNFHFLGQDGALLEGGRILKEINP